MHVAINHHLSGRSLLKSHPTGVIQWRSDLLLCSINIIMVIYEAVASTANGLNINVWYYRPRCCSYQLCKVSRRDEYVVFSIITSENICLISCGIQYPLAPQRCYLSCGFHPLRSFDAPGSIRKRDLPHAALDTSGTHRAYHYRLAGSITLWCISRHRLFLWRLFKRGCRKTVV